MCTTRPSSSPPRGWSSMSATGQERVRSHAKRPRQRRRPASTLKNGEGRMLVGESTLTVELVPEWEQLPSGWTHGDVAGVATDAQDRVFVFNRGEHPVIIYDRDGRFVKSWGEGLFTRPHGITIHDDVVYCADDTDHTVRALTLDGQLLWTLGTLNQPSDTGYSPEGRSNLLSIKRGGGPFNRPTRLAVAPNGELYVSDGYGNARIHHFSADRQLVQSWGEPGTEPGRFNLPHSLWVH